MGRESDLYELLLFFKKQDPKVLTKLKEYLNTSISRTNEKERQLFNYVVQLKIADLRKFNTQKACKLLQLSTQQTYPVQQKLLKHIEQFLVFQEMQKDTNLQRNTLLKVYQKYGIEKMFNATIKRKLVMSGRDYLHKKYEAHLIEGNWIAKQNRDQHAASLEILSGYLKDYYETEALRLEGMKLIRKTRHKNATSEQANLTFSPLKESAYRNEFPITYLYCLIYKLTAQRTETPNPEILDDYELLANCIFGYSKDFLNKQQLKPECQIDIFSTLQNFCVAQINSSKDNSNRQKYLNKLSELIIKGQEQGLLKEMRNDTFITAIMIWIRLKQYDTVRKFLDNPKSRFLLPQKYRTCTPNLAEALYFHYLSEDETKPQAKAKYISKTYIYLNKMNESEEMKDIRHRSYIDLIWAKINIHTRDFDDTHLRLENLYNFLNKQGIQNYNLSIHYMKKLIAILRIQDEQHISIQLQSLVEELNKTANFPLKDWMLKEIV